MRRKVFTTSILCAMLAVAAWLPALAHAQSQAPATPRTPAAQPGILPPPGHAYGRTYSQWSVAWWQYVLARATFDENVNPLLNPTGANCANGQSGPVFFLVGTSSSGSATRSQCTVPAGKALFFPLVNAFDVHVACTPQTLSVCDTNDTPDKVWADLQAVVFDAGRTTDLHATIDGVSVRNLTDPATTPYRTCVGPVAGCNPPSFFSVTLPDGNVFGVPQGTYSPAVADGYYLLLAPLTPGKHTITFGGTSNNTAGTNETTQDITYNLTVSAP